MDFTPTTRPHSACTLFDGVLKPPLNDSSPSLPRASPMDPALLSAPQIQDSPQPWPQGSVPHLTKQESARPARGSSPSTVPVSTHSYSTTTGTSFMSNIMFWPRPYEELYAEQAYLVQSLNSERAKSADLRRRYAWIEFTPRDGSGGPKRRQVTKHRKTLENRINASGEQQRLIYLRLGEVYMEIQSRDMWSRAQLSQQHRRPYGQDLGSEPNSEPGALAPSALQPPDASNILSSPLNGASPTFVPRFMAASMTIDERSKETATVPALNIEEHPEKAVAGSSSPRLGTIPKQDEWSQEQKMGFIPWRPIEEAPGNASRMWHGSHYQVVRPRSLPNLRSFDCMKACL